MTTIVVITVTIVAVSAIIYMTYKYTLYIQSKTRTKEAVLRIEKDIEDSLKRLKESMEGDNFSSDAKFKEGVVLAKGLVLYSRKEHEKLAQLLCQYYQVDKIFKKEIDGNTIIAIGLTQEPSGNKITILTAVKAYHFKPKEFCDIIISTLDKARTNSEQRNNEHSKKDNKPDWFDNAN